MPKDLRLCRESTSIPAFKGTYILVFSIGSTLTVKSKRRSWTLEPGVYAYVGSAGGPGGLRSRLRRHLCSNVKRVWWHIDRVTVSDEYEPLLVVYCVGDWGTSVEHCISRCLSTMKVFKPIPGFGCSDDRLSLTHLYQLPSSRAALCNLVVCMVRCCTSYTSLLLGSSS